MPDLRLVFIVPMYLVSKKFSNLMYIKSMHLVLINLDYVSRSQYGIIV